MRLSACDPPFRIFIIGTGKIVALGPPIYLNKLKFDSNAAAFASARDTPKIAFAPRFDLLSVPSNFIIALSIPSWSKISLPCNASFKIEFTFFTAFKTPFPK